MSDSIESTTAAFREAITKFIVPLQTTRVIKMNEFDAMDKSARELTSLLKGNELVSKSLLNEFFITVQVIRNEAPYFGKDSVQLEELARKIEYYLGLILTDETPEQRIPGVPRII
jgi:hypothetical protein